MDGAPRISAYLSRSERVKRSQLMSHTTGAGFVFLTPEE
jgi:hypothetical protein